MIEEIRISSLGVIDESVLELGEGLTVITGETGAGKTMLVTALGLLLGGRADTGAVRTGARAARVEGVVRADATLGAIADEHGGEVESGQLLLGRQVSAEGRSRAFLGGASVPASALARVGEALVAVHGQSDQHRLLRPEAQRDALDAFAGAELADGARRATAPASPACGRSRPSCARCSGRPASAPGRPTCCGWGSRRSRPSTPSRARSRRSRPRRRGSASPTPCARPPRPPARRCPPTRTHPMRSVRWPPPAGRWRACASTTPRSPALADRVAEVSYLLADVAADVASYSTAVETDPARLAAVSERRAALTALTRKYGETVDEVLEWSRAAAAAAGQPRRLRRADRRAAQPSATQLRAHAGRARPPSCPRLRAAAGERLSEAVTAELHSLSMPHARFEVRLDRRRGRARPRARRRPLALQPRPGSTRSSCCSRPTPGRSHGRWARAPPAASCPG